MSNPCINRWGLNSYWHHYWYSDSRYAINAHQDALYLRLLQLYMGYGLNTPLNTSSNWFWYKKSGALVSNESYLKRHYRWVTLYNPTLQSVKTYRLRRENEEAFQAKATVLKFNSWIVLNFYWFQPNKAGSRGSLRRASRTHVHVPTPSSPSQLPLQKLRTLTAAIYPSTLSTTLSYDF